MANICGNCNNWSCDKRRGPGELFCEQHHSWVSAISEACENFENLPFFGGYDKKERSSKAIEEAEREKPNCYISTAVVKILKMKDDCPTLQTLRFLRGYYMQNDPKYRDILMTYDVVGPMLAKALWEDENREQVASDIMICLQNATRLVAHEKMDEAIAIYVDMTENLIDLYSPSYTIGEVVAQNYDQASGGHGSFIMTKRG